MKSFWALVRRDVRLAVREGGAIGTALGFFLVVVSLMPLGLGPDLNLLARIAAGILWIALLLAALLSLGRIFETDYEDGDARSARDRAGCRWSLLLRRNRSHTGLRRAFRWPSWRRFWAYC